MRGWKIATSTSVASGRSCSSAASTAGQSGSGWPARSNGFQIRSRNSFTNASATLSAWRATSSMTSSALSSGIPSPSSVSPARSSVGLGTS